MLNRGVWFSLAILVCANLMPMPAKLSAAAPQADVKALTPLTVGAWAGRALEVDDRTVEILETDAVSLAEYKRPDAEHPIWLAHVAGLGQRAAYHPPELCYIGSHFEVVERERLQIAVDGRSVPVMRLVLSKRGELFEAWYWFTAQDKMTVNYYEQQLWLVWAVFRGLKPSGSLVRISTPADDQKAAHERLKDFLTQLLNLNGDTLLNSQK